MPFSKEELRYIDATVGALCRKASPAHIADKLRHIYEIEGHSVLVYSIAPRWDDPSDEIKHGVAKFRYFRSRDDWRLYWLRADLKWHLYEPEDMLDDLESLVSIVDEDKYGAFFG